VNIIIVGLGGIGSMLCDNLLRYLNHLNVPGGVKVDLIDGDHYETKNSERQTFSRLGDKASVKCAEMNYKFNNIVCFDHKEFINENNVARLIPTGAIVFLCVDNHISRKVISNHCQTLNDVTVISGGNEYTDGNVQLFQRKGGVNLTANLTEYHPEIEFPEDQSPEDMSCEELSKSEPQLLFTNLTVATIMCWMFYSIYIGKDITKHGEVYFDISSMATLAKVRTPKSN